MFIESVTHEQPQKVWPLVHNDSDLVSNINPIKFPNSFTYCYYSRILSMLY